MRRGGANFSVPPDLKNRLQALLHLAFLFTAVQFLRAKRYPSPRQKIQNAFKNMNMNFQLDPSRNMKTEKH